MEKEPPFRLVRDALGFYSQVPIVEPLVAEDAIEEVVVSEPVVEKHRKIGRPSKRRLNSEFEVDV